MNVLKKIYFLKFFCLFLFILSFACEVKAELTFEYHIGVRPLASGLEDADGDDINRDLLEDPTGIAFSNDGLKAFTTNEAGDGDKGKCVTETTLTVPFDFRHSHTQTDRADVLANAGQLGNNKRCEDIKFSRDGTRMIISNQENFIFSFELTKPFSLKHINYENFTHFFVGASFDINDDGTKLFTMTNARVESIKILKEHSLSVPYDVSTATLIHSTELGSRLVIDESYSDDFTHDSIQSLEFSKDGTMLFILVLNNQDEENLGNGFVSDEIFQFKLAKPFDTLTMSFVGSSNITSGYPAGNSGDYSRGFTITPNGDRLFIINQSVGASDIGNDSISQVGLSCFFGIGVCRTDIVGGIGSHVLSAKRNIQHNNSTMFKRFEWIKRNRNNENLNSFNINLNSYNPILASLTNKLQASLNNNSSKIKSDNWSFWSTGDVSMGRQDATITDRPKKIHTEGLTFGADRQIGDNDFAGVALRYAQNNSGVIFTDQTSKMDSLTLNFYGTSQTEGISHTNMILGYSLLRIDQKYKGKKTGNRNGQQVFASANFRTKKNNGRFNLTPSGKFSYGVTRLSDFTDFISTVTTGLNDQHESEEFENVDVSFGILFDTIPFELPNATITPNGGLEFVMDISPMTTFQYDHGQSITSVDVYSERNLRSNIGFEFLNSNNLSFSANYERFQHLDMHRSNKTETLILKVGHSLERDSEFALNYDPINAHKTTLSYLKNINGFDYKINSNQSFDNDFEHLTNLEVSGKF